MKKTIFYLITILLVGFIIETGSFISIKIYSLLSSSEKKNLENNKYIYETDILEKKSYHAFYGWKGLYSNKNKYKSRESIINKKWNKNDYIYFFGGSTMIGAGVNFKGTIPSHAAKLDHHYQPINLGEHGWVSGQSLNRMIEIIDDIKKGDHVIFYDGVNDTFVNCNLLNGPNGHSEVKYFRDILQNENNFFYRKLTNLFLNTNTAQFLNGAIYKVFKINLKEDNMLKNYGCADSNYSLEVAKTLIRHWKSAETLINSKGAKFSCILQPNPYTAKFKTIHPSRKIWKLSIQDVYPNIEKLAKELDCFHNLSDAFDKDYYTDWCCHVSSNGNKFLARKIIDKVMARTK